MSVVLDLPMGTIGKEEPTVFTVGETVRLCDELTRDVSNQILLLCLVRWRGTVVSVNGSIVTVVCSDGTEEYFEQELQSAEPQIAYLDACQRQSYTRQ